MRNKVCVSQFLVYCDNIGGLVEWLMTTALKPVEV